MADIAHLAVGFANALRKNGITIGHFNVLTFVRALGVLGIQDRQHTYWAGRQSLINNPAHLPIYDKTFKSYWLATITDETNTLPNEQIDETANEDSYKNASQDEVSPDFDISNEDPDKSFRVVRYSSLETIAQKDFALCSPEEIAEAKQAISKMRISIPQRSSRRLRPGKSKTRHLDIGRIARMATQTQGEPLRQAYLKVKQVKRRVVLILDISGSMEIYSRVLMRFAHALKASHQKVEVFVLSTRLTRITKELAIADPDRSLNKVSQAVQDWSGGTRLGEGIQDFNNKWGSGLARGAIVIISSDGWDLGNPRLLDEQMRRLQRVAHKIIWVNPLKASPGYEPLAQGMSAALPHIDNFLEGHSLYALESLADLISQ